MNERPVFLWTFLALVLVMLALGLTLLVYRCPWGFNMVFGSNHTAPHLFRWALWGGDLPSLSAGPFALLGLLLIGGQWLAYGLAASSLWRRPAVSVGLLFFVPALIGAIYVFMPPLFTTDTETYAMMGRSWAFSGQNTYLWAPSMEDPYFLFRPCTRTFVYGPLAWFYSTAMARLSGESLLLAVLGFKAGGAIFHLLTTFLMFRVAERIAPGRGRMAALLYGWNPLALLELAGSGHNEGLMMVLMALALWLHVAGERWRWLGLVAAVASSLVKYSSLPFVVFYLVSCIRQQERRQLGSRVVWPALGLALSLVILVGAFWLLPDGGFRGALHGIRGESALPRISSPGAWLPRLALSNALDPPGSALVQSLEAQNRGAQLAGLWGAGLGALLILWQTIRLFRGTGSTTNLVAAWVVTILVSLVMLSPAFFPWYLLWLLVPLAGVWWVRGTLRKGLLVTVGLGSVLMALYFVPV